MAKDRDLSKFFNTEQGRRLAEPIRSDRDEQARRERLVRSLDTSQQQQATSLARESADREKESLELQRQAAADSKESLDVARQALTEAERANGISWTTFWCSTGVAVLIGAVSVLVAILVAK